MIKLPKIMRTDLIQIAEASTGANHPALMAQVAYLKVVGPYTEATEDEIDAFDLALDAAEGA